MNQSESDIYAECVCNTCKEKMLIYLKNYDDLDNVKCPLCDEGFIRFERINGGD